MAHPSKTSGLSRHRLRALLIAIPLLFSCLYSAVVYAQESSDPLSSLSVEAQSIVLAINRIRSERGLAPLAVHPLLNQAAQAHVDEMVARRRYGHRGGDGSTVTQRIQRTGYPLVGRPGENWVAVRDVERAIRWWMNDAPHRANILNPRWREIGVGVAPHPGGWGMIFVTDFTEGSGDQLAGLPAVQDATPAEVEPETIDVPPEGIDYTVVAGDTLIGIGVRFGVDWPLIAAANGLTEDSLLQIGQVIRVPGANTPAPSAAEVTQIVARQEDTAAIIPAGPYKSYFVQPGDTLSGIAARFGLSWRDLARANGLGEEAVLQVGVVLRIPLPAPAADQPPPSAAPSATTAAAATTVAAATTTSAAQPAQIPDAPKETNAAAASVSASSEPTARAATVDASTQQATAAAALPSGTPATYMIRAGDTLSRIAARFGISWQELARANGLSENDILSVGSTLVIPTTSSAVNGAPARTHIVANGDTIIAIAQRYGVDWRELLRLNGLSETSLLRVGQVIRLP